MWVVAINGELKSLFEKQVYDECNLPSGKRAITTRFVLHIKRDVYGNIDKYKARLVARGFKQQEDIDFMEIVAPTAQTTSFRVLCSIAAQEKLDMQQIDVSTAFLNGELQEEVFVRPPACLWEQMGQDSKAHPTAVWRLKKALYALKQSAKAWNDKLVAELSKLGFSQSEGDPCLFMRGAFRQMVYLLVHVDDLVIAGEGSNVARVKKEIAQVFTITDLGPAREFLSIEIIRSAKGIMLT
jgi:hypothetical protein